MPFPTRRAILVATLGLAALPALPVMSARADDRPPTAEERRQIEAALRRHGFVRWGKIELDDGRWEVDDAVREDGRKYELELSTVDFSIVKLERDD